MISDSSQWVDINSSWELSSLVTQIEGGYALNDGRIEADITLSGLQITNKYGLIFSVANLVPETIYHTNYCELVCYDESGSMLNASLTYFKLLENERFWVEVDVPHKTHRIEYRFDGRYDVVNIQLYAINNAATVNIATTEKVGTVMPSSGLAIKVDGKLTVDPATASAGDFLGESKTLEAALNEVFQCTSDAFNLFKTSINSKGGTVAEPLNKTNINNGILSIPSGDLPPQRKYNNRLIELSPTWEQTSITSVEGRYMEVGGVTDAYGITVAEGQDFLKKILIASGILEEGILPYFESFESYPNNPNIGVTFPIGGLIAGIAFNYGFVKGGYTGLSMDDYMLTTTPPSGDASFIMLYFKNGVSTARSLSNTAPLQLDTNSLSLTAYKPLGITNPSFLRLGVETTIIAVANDGEVVIHARQGKYNYFACSETANQWYTSSLYNTSISSTTIPIATPIFCDNFTTEQLTLMNLTPIAVYSSNYRTPLKNSFYTLSYPALDTSRIGMYKDVITGEIVMWVLHLSDARTGVILNITEA